VLAANVAINLFSTAIWEFAIAPLYRGARPLKRRPTRRGQSLLDDSVRRAGSQLSRATHDSGLSTEKWAEFVESQEVASLLHDVFAFRMDQTDPSLDDIEVAFIGLWRAFLDEHNLKSDYDVADFFDQLIAACNNLLDAAIATEAISAHEAKSAARHKVVMARIESLSGRDQSSLPHAMNSQILSASSAKQSEHVTAPSSRPTYSKSSACHWTLFTSRRRLAATPSANRLLICLQWRPPSSDASSWATQGLASQP
jgi:hypothetical protein